MVWYNTRIMECKVCHNLPGIIKALCEVGYAGVCSIEYEKNFNDNYADLAECAGHYRALVGAAEAWL